MTSRQENLPVWPPVCRPGCCHASGAAVFAPTRPPSVQAVLVFLHVCLSATKGDVLNVLPRWIIPAFGTAAFLPAC